MYGSIFRNSIIKTREYRLLILGQSLPSFADIVNNKHSIEIDHLFPVWILDTKENSTNVFHLFLQTYYNWLYNESGYWLNKTSTNISGLIDLADLDKTDVGLLQHFAYTYVSGFPQHTINQDTEQNVRVFIKNIRRDFYQRKSNENAYFYFFDSLYNSQTINEKPVNVELRYPKNYILRLNGGKFEGWPKFPIAQCCYYTQPGGDAEPELKYCEEEYVDEVNCLINNGTYIKSDGLTGDYDKLLHLGGSYLNSGMIQDSNFFQNYSYTINTNVDVDPATGIPLYNENLMELLHPVGIKAFLEMTIEDYVAPGDYKPDIFECETPVLGNYFAYRLNDVVSLGQCSGCTTATIHDGPTAMFNNVAEGDLGGAQGWTSGNAWLTLGPGGITLPYNIPTHTYPDWADGITGDETQYPFKNIYLVDFLNLCPLSRSLNIGITGCTAQGSPGAC